MTMSSELNELRVTARRLSVGVSQSVKALGEAGFRYLLESHRTGFQDFSYLQKSFESLTKALQRDRKNPDYYCALAYLCVLVKDFRTAHRYLDTLALFSPDESDAQFLMDYLRFRAPELFPEESQENPLAALLEQNQAQEESPENTGERPAQAQSKPDPDMDYDQLYEKVEAQIYQRLRSYMQLHLPSMSVDANEIKILEGHEERLSILILELHEKLRILEQDMDVSELTQNLRPLEQQLSRIRAILDLSRRTRKLKVGLSRLTRDVMETHKQCDKRELSNQAFESKLEVYLDRCDALADQLDELENAGHGIQAMEKPYERVISLIESLQEKIDEL